MLAAFGRGALARQGLPVLTPDDDSPHPGARRLTGCDGGFPDRFVKGKGNADGDTVLVEQVGSADRAAVMLCNDSHNVETHTKVQAIVRARGADRYHGVENVVFHFFRNGRALVGDKQRRVSPTTIVEPV